jgi:hypothetical protein
MHTAIIAVAIKSEIPQNGIMSYSVMQPCPVVDTHIIAQAMKSSTTIKKKHNHFIIVFF